MTDIPATTTTARRFQVQVLAGIAAGEVRRVQVGNAVHMEWHKPTGHVTNHGVVYTRRPTHTVGRLIEAGQARVRRDDLIELTPVGKRRLAREGG